MYLLSVVMNPISKEGNLCTITERIVHYVTFITIVGHWLERKVHVDQWVHHTLVTLDQPHTILVLGHALLTA